MYVYRHGCRSKCMVLDHSLAFEGYGTQNVSTQNLGMLIWSALERYCFGHVWRLFTAGDSTTGQHSKKLNGNQEMVGGVLDFVLRYW